MSLELSQTVVQVMSNVWLFLMGAGVSVLAWVAYLQQCELSHCRRQRLRNQVIARDLSNDCNAYRVQLRQIHAQFAELLADSIQTRQECLRLQQAARPCAESVQDPPLPEYGKHLRMIETESRIDYDSTTISSGP